jgi:hypothetical protein
MARFMGEECRRLQSDTIGKAEVVPSSLVENESLAHPPPLTIELTTPSNGGSCGVVAVWIRGSTPRSARFRTTARRCWLDENGVTL